MLLREGVCCVLLQEGVCCVLCGWGTHARVHRLQLMQAWQGAPVAVDAGRYWCVDSEVCYCMVGDDAAAWFSLVAAARHVACRGALHGRHGEVHDPEGQHDVVLAQGHAAWYGV
jgi:hypothetical protein